MYIYGKLLTLAKDDSELIGAIKFNLKELTQMYEYIDDRDKRNKISQVGPVEINR